MIFATGRVICQEQTHGGAGSNGADANLGGCKTEFLGPTSEVAGAAHGPSKELGGDVVGPDPQVVLLRVDGGGLGERRGHGTPDPPEQQAGELDHRAHDGIASALVGAAVLLCVILPVGECRYCLSGRLAESVRVVRDDTIVTVTEDDPIEGDYLSPPRCGSGSKFEGPHCVEITDYSQF